MNFSNPSPITVSNVTNTQPQVKLGSFTWDVADDASKTFVLPAGCQSLMLLVSLENGAPSFPCGLEVIGATTGLIYFEQVIAPLDWATGPVSPVIDSSVTVKAFGQGGAPTNFPLTVYVVARIDPAVVELAGIKPGFETNRYQPVIPSSPPITNTAVVALTGTLIPAPASPPWYPNAIRLWILGIRVTAAAGVTVTGTISAAGSEIVSANGVQAGNANVYVGGLILPINTAVLFNSAGATACVAHAAYDYVSID